jgi:hypothetical protein
MAPQRLPEPGARRQRGATPAGFRTQLQQRLRNRAAEERVPVVARVAGAEFARFHVDLSSGDAVVAAPETLTGSDLLAFAGLPPVRFPVYPVAQHLAEKLHAYTLPRTKDLVDLVVIAASDAVAGDTLLAALRATFEARGTHPLPARLSPPDPSWRQPFRALASQSPLSPTTDLTEGYRLAALFWEPVLRGTVAGRHWDASRGAWHPEAPGG